MAERRYAHLHVHSDFSFTEGASGVPALVKRAAEVGCPAMAVTDFDNLHGALFFSKEAVGAGMQPILGVEVGAGAGGLVLLAQNETGYANICKIVAEVQSDPKGAGKQAFWSALAENGKVVYGDGVICLTGGKSGFLRNVLRDKGERGAAQWLGALHRAFPGRVYLEIARDGTENADEADEERKLIEIAHDAERVGRETPLVAAAEAFYATSDRHEAWELLRGVEAKKTVKTVNGKIVSETDARFHLRDADEMEELFRDVPEALRNTLEVAKRCAVKAETRDPVLPAFQTGAGAASEDDELARQAREGLRERFEEQGVAEADRQDYWDRLERELGIIGRMGFPGYFLIVSDFIKWAKGERIPVGPGRGSGAGSLVAYALRITDLDPLRWGLLFERFLNPDRVSMPDFDVDFCQDRRDEVIAYTREKYGEDKVAHICTFGEIKSRTAIKDAGRVLNDEEYGGMGFYPLNEFSKSIPTKTGSPDPMPLSEALDEAPELRKAVESDPKKWGIWQNAKKIEGLYRQVSTHAAGVVIGDRPLHQMVPVGWDSQKGKSVTQFNMKHAEASGLVKFDFLGLTTLSVIAKALENIRATTGEDIDVSTVPVDDPEVYDLLAKGDTGGVFQLESEGMRETLRQMRPDRFEDVIAAVALYRPGPMQNIPTYNGCKNGRIEPEYPVPAELTKPILEETFGIIVYQEQVMEVAQRVAGYSLGQADLLRRAMGKKIASEMEKQRKVFVEGCVANGVSEGDGEALFKTVEKFASYGFNKSHAAAYAAIAYRTAWLKRHYPAQFMAALMSYERADADKLSALKDDLEARGIRLLPPDVNRSGGDFLPEADERSSVGLSVRFGLSAIKNVAADVSHLVDERARNGEFKGLLDFHRRAGGHFNGSSIERMCEAGAFDGMSGTTRAAAQDVLKWLAKNDKPKQGGADLFGEAAPVRVPDGLMRKREWGDKVDREYKSVGFYFNEHPLDPYVERLKKAGVKRRKSIEQYMRQKGVAELQGRRVCVIVEEVQHRYGKTGNPYVFLVGAEKGDEYKMVFFNGRQTDVDEVYATLDAARNSRMPVVISADFTLENQGVNMVGRAARPADEVVGEVDVPGVTIMMSHEAVQPRSKDEYEKVKEAENGQKTAVLNRLLKDRIEHVISRLQRHRSEDGSGSLVAIRIQCPDGQERIMHAKSGSGLEGRFHVNQDVERQLKILDGVTDMADGLPQGIQDRSTTPRLKPGACEA